MTAKGDRRTKDKELVESKLVEVVIAGYLNTSIHTGSTSDSNTD